MSSSKASIKEVKTNIIYEAVVEESSAELPMEEWSSLIIELPEQNRKRLLYEQGLYSPGSGDLCNKYVAMSASSVFRHPYYDYPAVIDPGIKPALLEPEPKITYPDDGQELYLTLCKDMNQCPVKIFYRGLVKDTIDLKYYCIDPAGVRAMTLALQYNKNVNTFNLTDNFLNDDACFHLGEMLISNNSLRELNLTGCKIGPKGAKQLFAGLHINRGLKILILDKNEIGDDGVEYLAAVIFRGIDIQQISLSYNSISGKSANVLAEALEIYNKFTHINLSWNQLFGPIMGTVNLFTRMSENKVLQEVNLSWNSLSNPRIGTAIKSIFKAPNLRVLDISHNRLSGEAIQNFIENMGKAKKMVTLDLSYNPLTPEDAVKVLQKMKLNTTKIQNLLMDNVFVTGEFLRLLDQIKAMKNRKTTVITYGGVIGGFKPTGPDMRELVLNRVEFLTMKGKKKKVDVALIALQMVKDKIDILPAKMFADAIVASGAPLDSDLLDEIVNAFAGPKSGKAKTISVSLLVDYIHRKWPDRKLPPTPPPELEPEPEPIAEVKPELKGKRKKKK
ncbi:unnamed protein product, partial [Brenthis ino]